jgi:hypothetical protein
VVIRRKAQGARDAMLDARVFDSVNDEQSFGDEHATKQQEHREPMSARARRTPEAKQCLFDGAGHQA